mmetsp:Transcript_100736/g.325099  ORF Transcript_100736/g.325099 Transcript_100736/m.325099 type:complete len:218 (+) Transcript_100736:92-745(+)
MPAAHIRSDRDHDVLLRGVASLGKPHAWHGAVECRVVPLQHWFTQDEGLGAQRSRQVDVHQHGYAHVRLRLRDLRLGPAVQLGQGDAIGGRHLWHHLWPCVVGRVEGDLEVAKVDLEARARAAAAAPRLHRPMPQAVHEPRPQGAGHAQQGGAGVHDGPAGAVVAEVELLPRHVDADDVQLPMAVMRVACIVPGQRVTLLDVLRPPTTKGDLAVLVI